VDPTTKWSDHRTAPAETVVYLFDLERGGLERRDDATVALDSVKHQRRFVEGRFFSGSFYDPGICRRVEVFREGESLQI
jgi:hypothetical protein